MPQPQTRMTRQRALILEELRKLSSHPTADELYNIVRERLPRISLGTVYRNLDFLVASGQILEIDVPGSTRRFDGNTHPHQHVRCVRCGCVADVFPAYPLPDIEGMNVAGFCVTSARLEFDGICEACRRAVQDA